MDLNDKEHAELAEAFNTGGVKAVAAHAVSIFLASASGQVDDAALEDLVRDHVGPTDSRDAEAVRRAFRAQASALAQEAEALRAKVAELEAENRRLTDERDAAETSSGDADAARDALRTEVERLKAQAAADLLVMENGSRMLREAESRLAAIRERLGDTEAMRAFVDAHGMDDGFARWVLEGDAPQESKDHVFVPHRKGDDVCQEPGDFAHSICGRPRASHRYPCSPTCTHDDAATPGHPERVKERSEVFDDLAKPHDPSNPAHEHQTDTLSNIAWPEDRRRGYEEGWEKGAEAMRAACLNVALEWAKEQGFRGEALENIKHRIEVAVP